MDARRFPLVLYKRILRLHYGLPAEFRQIGDVYVKDEWRRHKSADPGQALVFLREWTTYYSTLAKQMSLQGIASGQRLGAELTAEEINKFSEEQLYQLFDLKTQAQQSDTG